MSKTNLCIYRNRHGTFYFRLYVPRDLHESIEKTEFRFSLETGEKSHARIAAQQILGGLPQLFAELRRMAEEDEQRPPDFLEKVEAHIRQRRYELLQWKCNRQEEKMQQMVPIDKAKEFGRLMHERGELRGKKELEDKLMFPPPPERTPLYSTLRDAYLKSLQSNRAGRGIKKPPTEKTMAEYRVALDLFIAVMGDRKIGEIDEEMVGDYFGKLSRLPANMKKLAIFRGKTIPQILKMNPPPQDPATSSQKMERVSGMFKWATDAKRRRKWGIEANFFEGYGQSKRERKKPSVRPLTDEELNLLFNHPDFAQRRFRKSYAFWLMPLAIFTGARLGELCQLELKDFVEVGGVPCIDINDEAVSTEDRKQLKTANATRLVPVHHELVRIGIMRHVERMRQQGHTRLFPELNAKRRDGPGHAASNWFQRFREKAGVLDKGAVFHSLRHLFITTLLDTGVAPHLVAPVVGHEAELVTGKVYFLRPYDDLSSSIPRLRMYPPQLQFR
ncbi:MAG: DUF6538 domain-containing protein [Burkholderiales bacterium]